MISTKPNAVFAALLFAGAVGITGCSSSDDSSATGTPDSGGNASPDSSIPDAQTTSDASSVDTGTGTDAGTPAVDCGSVPPTGKQIVASTSPLVLQGAGSGGLTSDGNAFYQDYDKQVLYAVSADGGAPTSLGTVTSQSGSFYLNGGKGALYLPSAANPITNVAPLSSWTAATGPSVISTTALAYDSYYYTYDISQDGKWVAYFVVAADDLTATLTLSSSDGKTQKTLATGVDLTNLNGCSPIVQFVKSTGDLLTYFCPAASASSSDAGQEDAAAAAGGETVESFVGATFDAHVLTTLASPVGGPQPVSPDGASLLLPTPDGSGGLVIFPISGAASSVLDANGAGGVFTSTGQVLYSDVNGALILSGSGVTDAGTDGGAVSLVSTGVAYVVGLSPDGQWVMTADQANSSGQFTDLSLASATKPGSLTALWPDPTALFFGFSADSKYEAFGTNFPTNFSINTFDLESSAIAGGAAPAKILTSAGSLTLTTGSKLVTNVNPNTTTGAADIVSVDLSSTGAPTPLVTQADPNFFYDKGTNQIVYSWYCASGATSGIWSISAP